MTHTDTHHHIEWHTPDWSSVVWWAMAGAVVAILVLALSGIGSPVNEVTTPGEISSLVP